MKIRFHKNFEKQYKKPKDSEQKKTQERLSVFLQTPYSPILNNHPLKGKYLDYRSINITGDLRAIYKDCGGDKCIFVAVDTHSNLYS
ncbi:MAG: type II toxin-antitoxin system mRNA interferase toxin, RelE/StbE family [bacterium]